MNTLAVEIRIPEALNALLTDDTLSVDLSDGRSISVPIAWFPRLLHSTEQERNNWRLIGKGQGIHWEDIDEDIPTAVIIEPRPQGDDAAASFAHIDDHPISASTGDDVSL